MAHTMLPTCHIQPSAYGSHISLLLAFTVFAFPFIVSVFAVVVILG